MPAFKTYMASLGVLADTSTDPGVLVQRASDGEVFQMPLSTISALLTPPVFINATAGNVIESLPNAGQILYVRTDDSANNVTINPSVPGQTVDFQPFIQLYTQGESARLLFDPDTNNWYRLRG